MFVEERHKKILEILNRDKRIKARDIESLFSVGFDTARRDLRILEEQGLLKRTHGGAIPLIQVGAKLPEKYTPRGVKDVKSNYLNIALEAVKLINENDVVYITGASVGFFMVKNLPTDLEFTVVTNSIIIADELRNYDKISVFVLGGLMNSKGHLRNHFTVEMIKNMRFDLAFLTGGAYSPDFGMSIGSSDTILIFKAIIESTRICIGLFPHEKMGITSILKVCDADVFNTIITDSDTRTDEINKIKELGVDIIVTDR